MQHCSAAPPKSRQKYSKIGQIPGVMMVSEKAREGGTPPSLSWGNRISRKGQFLSEIVYRQVHRCAALLCTTNAEQAKIPQNSPHFGVSDIFGQNRAVGGGRRSGGAGCKPRRPGTRGGGQLREGGKWRRRAGTRGWQRRGQQRKGTDTREGPGCSRLRRGAGARAGCRYKQQRSRAGAHERQGHGQRRGGQRARERTRTGAREGHERQC